jgi:hypothetical protein
MEEGTCPPSSSLSCPSSPFSSPESSAVADEDSRDSTNPFDEYKEEPADVKDVKLAAEDSDEYDENSDGEGHPTREDDQVEDAEEMESLLEGRYSEDSPEELAFSTSMRSGRPAFGQSYAGLGDSAGHHFHRHLLYLVEALNDFKARTRNTFIS